jgi:PEGA domain-containing protein
VTDARVQLLITTNVPGSEIAIDDIVVGTTPLREPLRVMPGRHKITVRHEGYVARTRFVDLDATNAGSLEVALTSSRAPEAAPEAAREAAPEAAPEAAIDAGGGTQPVRPIDPVNPYAPDR